MSARHNMVQIAIYGAIALAAVIGAVVLGYHGTLSSDAVAAVLTGALALAGGSAAGIASLNTVVNGKSVVTPQLIAEQGANVRTALVAAASTEPRTVTPVEPEPAPPAEG